MPRSIQQLKHRNIYLATLQPEQLAAAARSLEKMPGIYAETVQDHLAVHYWIDEYTLADLELALLCQGFRLDEEALSDSQHTQITQEEESEREDLALPLRVSCQSCGVFAHRLALRKDDPDPLPIYQ